MNGRNAKASGPKRTKNRFARQFQDKVETARPIWGRLKLCDDEESLHVSGSGEGNAPLRNKPHLEARLQGAFDFRVCETTAASGTGRNRVHEDAIKLGIGLPALQSTDGSGEQRDRSHRANLRESPIAR